MINDPENNNEILNAKKIIIILRFAASLHNNPIIVCLNIHINIGIPNRNPKDKMIS